MFGTPTSSMKNGGKRSRRKGENVRRTPIEDIKWGLKEDQRSLRKYQADLKKLQSGKKVSNLTIKGAKSSISGLKAVIKNKKKVIKQRSTTRQDTRYTYYRSRTGEYREEKVRLYGNQKSVEHDRVIPRNKVPPHLKSISTGYGNGKEYKTKRIKF